jgi:hypothetical protein
MEGLTIWSYAPVPVGVEIFCCGVTICDKLPYWRFFSVVMNRLFWWEALIYVSLRLFTITTSPLFLVDVTPICSLTLRGDEVRPSLCFFLISGDS